MRSIFAAVLFAAGLASAAPALAQEAAQPAEAPRFRVIAEDVSVPFANSRVDGFQVEDDRSLIFRVGANRWYRAVVWQPCKSDLRWVNHIGFDTTVGNTLDKFSYVYVRGQRCPITSIDEITRPGRAEPDAPATQPN